MHKLDMRPPEGPFRAHQVREGDPYELSDGHAIRCMTAGNRHGGAHTEGAKVLGTDPAASSKVSVDAGFAWNEGKNLRAPDLSITDAERRPGWLESAPALALEYADAGQDERELQDKIAELLAAGTRVIWVVRLVGQLRVEVYRPECAVETVEADGVLTAPGILDNPVSVRSLVDPEAADEAALRNLLGRKGYPGLDAVRGEGSQQAARKALRTVLSARGVQLTDAHQARIDECADPAVLDQWMARAATAESAGDVFDA